MGIVVVGVLFLASILNAGGFSQSHPTVFNAYATLAAIKAVDSHVETLVLLKQAMHEFGNHSDVDNIASAYRQCCVAITKSSKGFNTSSSLASSLEDYRRYTESRTRVTQFINALPSLYKEICLFDGKELVSADCGLWAVKALLPHLSTSLESLASIVDDIQVYCVAKNPGEQFFNKIINAASTTFTTEKIDQVISEYGTHSDSLVALYTKNSKLLLEWAIKADLTLQKELLSIKTTNPHWNCVGIARQSTELLFSHTLGDAL